MRWPPGCAVMCVRALRLQGCGAQREIVEFMDICKTAQETCTGPGRQPDAGVLCGVQHLCPPALPPEHRKSEPSVRGWHLGDGLGCDSAGSLPLPHCPPRPPCTARSAVGRLAQHAVPHGCGRHRHFHRAMTTPVMGTKRKLCSATSIINAPHPAVLPAVPAPCVVPCPFCSEKPPAPGSPCLPARLP